MTKEQVESRIALAALLGSMNGVPVNVIIKDVRTLGRLAGTLNSLNLKQCNDPRWDDSDYAKRERTQSKVRLELSHYCLCVEFNNDPRGYGMYVYRPRRCQKCLDTAGKDGLGRVCKGCNGTGAVEPKEGEREPNNGDWGRRGLGI